MTDSQVVHIPDGIPRSFVLSCILLYVTMLTRSEQQFWAEQLFSTAIHFETA